MTLEIIKDNNNIYSFILRKIFEGSNTHLTNTEYDILNVICLSDFKWNTQILKEKLKMDTFSLNNYKARLLKKNLLEKELDQTIITKRLNNLKDIGNEFTLSFSIKKS